MTKKEQYDQLVADVTADYSSREPDTTVVGPKLIWCDDCREINLWTYWQGSLDARIMLIGQDWGCSDESESWETAETLRRVRAVNDRSGPPFFPVMAEKTVWTTDANLTVLFRVIGYDIMQKQPDLFFTNLVLGYRDHGTSSLFRQKWIRDDAHYFKRLVEIIEPQAVICLGKSTFEGSIYALTGKMRRIKGFNRFLDSGANWQDIKLPGDKVARVFAVAHCGTIGTMNRNRGKASNNGCLSSNDLSVQVNDWAKIRDYLEERKCSPQRM